jgi:hypothetical protein
MGYGSCHSVEIDAKDVEKICPETYKAFMDLIIDKIEGLNLEAVAHADQTEDWEYINEDITDAEIEEVKKHLEALKKDFEAKTKVDLYLCFHDSDDQGSCYDMVNGAYWCLGNVYQLTPEAKKLKETVDFNDVYFVTFG